MTEILETNLQNCAIDVQVESVAGNGCRPLVNVMAGNFDTALSVVEELRGDYTA